MSKKITDIDEVIDSGNIYIICDATIYAVQNSAAHKYAEEHEQGYILDNKGPNINIMTDKILTNKKQTLNIPVEVKDNYEEVGVKEKSIKYAISDSNIEAPSEEEFTNTVIDGNIEYEMQAGKKYIWVKAEDKLGNQSITVSNELKLLINGDINVDNKIDITDVVLLKRHLIAGNRTNWILTGDNLEAADMNENEKVDISDLLLLKREVAQNI